MSRMMMFSERRRYTSEKGNNLWLPLHRRKQHSIFKPPMIPLVPVPSYSVPRELIKALKRLEHNIEQDPDISQEIEEWFNFLKLLPEMNIAESNYLKILQRLLYLEEYYNDERKEEFNLKKQVVRLLKSEDTLKLDSESDFDPIYTSHRFKIRLPGLTADDEPSSLFPNDILEVQEMWNPRKHELKVTSVGHNYVIVKATPEFLKTYQEEARYDVKFHCGNWSIRVCHFAISLVERVHLKGLAPLLHPVIREVSNQPKQILSWFDKNIGSNPQQMHAVQSILGRTAHPSPYLVFGPPGTGKTATIVEAISQIWKHPFGNRILVCTPSNAAADEITKRLLRNIPEPETLVYRMLSSTKDKRDVDVSIHNCSHFVGEDVNLLEKEEIMKMEIVITTLVNCVRLVRMEFNPQHFNYIFIDEAGQATQPETLIPLGLMSDCERINAQLVLSGDPKQLGPVVMTKHGQHLLGKSMLERLMDCFPLYQKGADDKFDPNFITKLVKNYRSHESILKLPNKLFYEDELLPCAGQEIYKAENWSELPNKKFPIVFHAVDGLEEREKNSSSACNEEEAEIVVKYVSKLLGRKLGESRIEEKDIGIVTPFRLQSSVIMRELQKKGWKDVSVGTVEIFQGQEKDVIIISTVRSCLFQHEGSFHIGFLSHEKRFNVTITRAKALLIVIGNPKVLQIDDCWREFITYCLKNEACVGEKFTLSEMTEDEMKILLTNRLQTKKTDKYEKAKPYNPKVHGKRNIGSGKNSNYGSVLTELLQQLDLS